MNPRNFTAPSTAGHPGLLAGLPQDRLARIAARRAFVETKQVFLEVVAALDADSAQAQWLQHQVRQAQQPEDLWLLRGGVFDALRRDPDNGPRLRQRLRRCLDGMFPGTFFTSLFSGF